jgi:hypothetical protein
LNNVTITEQPPESLLAAMAKTRIPTENHQFIRRVAAAIGIAEYRAIVSPDEPHAVAKRCDGLPDLHIFHGYTSGFSTEQEIAGVADNGAGRGPGTREGTWYVEHPTSRVRPASKRSADVRREGHFCSCGMQLSLTRVCANCD